MVFGEFVAHLRPKDHSMTIERVGDGRAYGPNLEPQSLDSLNIIQNGVTGSGPALPTATSHHYPGEGHLSLITNRSAELLADLSAGGPPVSDGVSTQGARCA